MKAITIRQPWASLIAAGVKTIETRSWSTKYRGPLAIHAGKHNDGSFFPCAYVKGTLFDHPRVVERRTLRLPNGIEIPHPGIESWPRGAVVATCTLADVVQIGPGVMWNGTPERLDGQPLPPENHGWLDPGPAWRWIYVADEADYPSLFINEGERPLGDFTPGRYAWLLTDVTPLADPVPAKGRLGLWDWEGT